MIGNGPTGVHHRPVIDVVKTGKNGEVHVGDVERLGVQCRESKRTTNDGVIHPQPVLEEQRCEPDGERTVGFVILTRHNCQNGREVTFQIDAAQFAYPVAPSLETAEWVRDPGDIQLHVGPNSRDTQTVTLTWSS